MPELCRLNGIIITMYYMDSEKHHKPHIHATYGEYEATVGIDGELLAGSFPRKQFRILVGWILLHEDELYKAWNLAVRGEKIDKIKPY